MAEDKKILTNRNGYWSKKIKGKVHYFGKDYKKAVAKYKADRPFLELGLKPEEVKQQVKGYTLRDLLNVFNHHQKKKMERDELSIRTYDDYTTVTDKIAECVPIQKALESLTINDFQVIRETFHYGVGGQRLAPKSTDKFLGYARTVFKFAFTNQLVKTPLPFENALKGVPKRELRKWKAGKPLRAFTDIEVRTLVKKADPRMKAMILLAINGGYNNSDIGRLETEFLFPLGDVLDYRRRKTYIRRVTPLWPETIEALEEYRMVRVPSPSKYFFVKKSHAPFYDNSGRSELSTLFREFLKRLKMYEEGKNFGALRTTFSNVGLEVGDDLAVKALMGHEDGSTLYESYAHGVYLPRLKKVTDHIRKWLNIDNPQMVEPDDEEVSDRY